MKDHDQKAPSQPHAAFLAAADARLAQAKHRFSLAALAAMRGALDAPQLVQQALAEVDAARAQLRRLHDGAVDTDPAAMRAGPLRERLYRGRRTSGT